MQSIDHDLEKKYNLAKHLIEQGPEFLARFLKNVEEQNVALFSDAETIATQAALLKDVLACVKPCEHCDETGTEPETEDACEFCGGYGFNVGGDIRETVLDIRKLLEVTK